MGRVLSLWLGLLLAGGVEGVEAEPKRPLLFERDVWPILAVNCVGCHGANAPKGGLDLRSVSRIMRGGESGPAVAESDPDSSLMLERIIRHEMPPGKARKLADQEVSMIRNWLRAGARAEHPDRAPPPVSPIRDEDRRFWSFRPLSRPPVPHVVDNARVRTPIDAFLYSQLDSKRLSFSPDADPATLVRRAYLDLLGLPPSPEEVAACLSDKAPNAL